METKEEKLLTELTGAMTEFKSGAKRDLANMQKQLDGIDGKIASRHYAGGDDFKSIADTLKETESLSRLMHDKRGHAVIELDGKQAARLFERKTTLTTTGGASLSTTGVLQIDRMPGITLEAREVLTIRDVLDAAPTEMQVVDYVKVATALSPASPQVEASAKFENTVTFTALSERVKLIATFIRASRQILDDMKELQNFLSSGLTYEVNLAEEIQLLSGNAAGENLNGLITQAAAFSPSTLSLAHGWNTIDVIGRTVEQIRTAKEVPPTFVILNPTDWWGMRLTKDNFGRYILGDPQSPVRPSIFGLKVVDTTNIAAGTFLVGSGDPAAAQIRDRMGLIIDISTEDANNFTTNLVTVRAEKRLALVVRRPNSFVSGTFTTSP